MSYSELAGTQEYVGIPEEQVGGFEAYTDHNPSSQDRAAGYSLSDTNGYDHNGRQEELTVSNHGNGCQNHDLGDYEQVRPPTFVTDQRTRGQEHYIVENEDHNRPQVRGVGPAYHQHQNIPANRGSQQQTGSNTVKNPNTSTSSGQARRRPARTQPQPDPPLGDGRHYGLDYQTDAPHNETYSPPTATKSTYIRDAARREAVAASLKRQNTNHSRSSQSSNQRSQAQSSVQVSSMTPNFRQQQSSRPGQINYQRLPPPSPAYDTEHNPYSGPSRSQGTHHAHTRAVSSSQAVKDPSNHRLGSQQPLSPRCSSDSFAPQSASGGSRTTNSQYNGTNIYGASNSDGKRGFQATETNSYFEPSSKRAQRDAHEVASPTQYGVSESVAPVNEANSRVFNQNRPDGRPRPRNPAAVSAVMPPRNTFDNQVPPGFAVRHPPDETVAPNQANASGARCPKRAYEVTQEDYEDTNITTRVKRYRPGSQRVHISSNVEYSGYAPRQALRHDPSLFASDEFYLPSSNASVNPNHDQLHVNHHTQAGFLPADDEATDDTAKTQKIELPEGYMAIFVPIGSQAAIEPSKVGTCLMGVQEYGQESPRWESYYKPAPGRPAHCVVTSVEISQSNQDVPRVPQDDASNEVVEYEEDPYEEGHNAPGDPLPVGLHEDSGIGDIDLPNSPCVNEQNKCSDPSTSSQQDGHWNSSYGIAAGQPYNGGNYSETDNYSSLPAPGYLASGLNDGKTQFQGNSTGVGVEEASGNNEATNNEHYSEASGLENPQDSNYLPNDGRLNTHSSGGNLACPSIYRPNFNAAPSGSQPVNDQVRNGMSTFEDDARTEPSFAPQSNPPSNFAADTSFQQTGCNHDSSQQKSFFGSSTMGAGATVTMNESLHDSNPLSDETWARMQLEGRVEGSRVSELSDSGQQADLAGNVDNGPEQVEHDNSPSYAMGTSTSSTQHDSGKSAPNSEEVHGSSAGTTTVATSAPEELDWLTFNQEANDDADADFEDLFAVDLP